jgi:hypothetical protein
MLGGISYGPVYRMKMDDGNEMGAQTFRRLAAVLVSFWQKPQTVSHLAIRRIPDVFHGGWV